MLCTAGLMCYSANGLYADGSYFLLQILQKSTFLDLDHARQHVQWVTQAPVVAAIRGGAQDINLLIRIHSFGLILPPVIAWMAALMVAARGETFWPMLVLYSAVYLSSGFFSVGEYNLAYALVALSGSILLGPQPFKGVRSVGLLVSATILVRSYESMLFLGPMLCVLIVCHPALYLPRQPRTGEYILAAALIALYLLAAGLSLYSINYPRDPANLARASDLRTAFISNRFLTYALLMAGLFICCSRTTYKRIQFGVAALASVLTVYLFLRWDSWPPAYAAHSSRIMSGLVLGFGLLWLAIQQRLSAIQNRKFPPTAVLIALVFFVSMNTALLRNLFEFRGWLRQLESALTVCRPTLQHRDVRSFDSYRFQHLDWMLPTLSVLLKVEGRGPIVLDEPHENWKPFEPRRPDQIPVIPNRFVRSRPLFSTRQNIEPDCNEISVAPAQSKDTLFG